MRSQIFELNKIDIKDMPERKKQEVLTYLIQQAKKLHGFEEEVENADAPIPDLVKYRYVFHGNLVSTMYENKQKKLKATKELDKKSMGAITNEAKDAGDKHEDEEDEPTLMKKVTGELNALRLQRVSLEKTEGSLKSLLVAFEMKKAIKDKKESDKEVWKLLQPCYDTLKKATGGLMDFLDELRKELVSKGNECTRLMNVRKKTADDDEKGWKDIVKHWKSLLAATQKLLAECASHSKGGKELLSKAGAALGSG